MPILVVTPSAETLQGKDVSGRILDGSLAATLGGFTFGAVDERGVQVWLASINGWFEAPGSTGAANQAAGDGGWLTQAYMKPRTIELLLRLRGASWDNVGATIDAIKAVIPFRRTDTLAVSSDGTLLQADVRQQGDILINRYGVSAEVSIALDAPDPRRYDVVVTTASVGLPGVTRGGLTLPASLPLSVAAFPSGSGVLVVNNMGNIDSPPTLIVQGPCPPFSISHSMMGDPSAPTSVLRFHDAIPAGRSLTIDTARRLAVMDGTATRTVTGTWFTYLPGANQVGFSAESYDPDARLTSVHRDAWR